MKKSAVGAVLVSAGLVAGGSAVAAQAGDHASAAGTKVVGVKDDFYSPKKVTINKRSTIKWSWAGSRFHDVKGPGFKAPLKKSGTYTHKFTRSGTYRIICTIHTNMVMSVVVR